MKYSPWNLVCFFSLPVKSGLADWILLHSLPSAWLRSWHAFLHSFLSSCSRLPPTLHSALSGQELSDVRLDLCCPCLQQGCSMRTCCAAAVAEREAVEKETGRDAVLSLLWQGFMAYRQWRLAVLLVSSVPPCRRQMYFPTLLSVVLPCVHTLWGLPRPWSWSQYCSQRARITHPGFLWDTKQWLSGWVS